MTVTDSLSLRAGLVSRDLQAFKTVMQEAVSRSRRVILTIVAFMLTKILNFLWLVSKQLRYLYYETQLYIPVVTAVCGIRNCCHGVLS